MQLYICPEPQDLNQFWSQNSSWQHVFVMGLWLWLVINKVLIERSNGWIKGNTYDFTYAKVIIKLLALYPESWGHIKFLNLLWCSKYCALLTFLIARLQIAEIGCKVSYLLALAHGVCLLLHYPVCFAVLGLLECTRKREALLAMRGGAVA